MNTCFREFLRSSPWAVSSNSQSAALTHPLVTHSQPWLACAPCEGDYEKGVGSASQGFPHILPRNASLIPLSCHMREINRTNHYLSSHSPPNQNPCSPSNFFPQKLFKKMCVLLYSLSPHNRLSNGAIVTFLCTIQHAHHTPTLGKRIKLNKFKKKLKIKKLKLKKKTRKTNLKKKTP